jgi:hypothetical protein
VVLGSFHQRNAGRYFVLPWLVSLMWWIFKSAFVRKLGYILAALLVGLVIHGHRAHAQQTQTLAYHNCNIATIPSANCVTYFTGSEFCAAVAQGESDSINSWSVTAVTPAGPPPDLSTIVQCSFHDTQNPSSCGGCSGGINGTPFVASGPAPSCAGLPNQDILAAISASSFSNSATGHLCVNSCDYVNGAVAGSMVITGAPGSGGLSLIGKAVPSGSQCTFGASTTEPSAMANCVSRGGQTLCHDPVSNVALVNGDIVNPASPPPAGQCSSFSDGNVVCNAGSTGTLSFVAGPKNAAGAPDIPVAQVTTAADVLDVFSAAQVSASPSPVATVNGGVVSGNPSGAMGTPNQASCTPSAAGVIPVVTCTGSSVSGTPGGTGTAASGPLAANGDCGASSVNCNGDSTLPDLTRTDTIQSNVQDYLNSISASPLFAAITSIETAWPSNPSCPSLPLTLFGKDMDLMTGACQVWGADVAPTLSLVFLAIWSCWGIRIVLSA